MSKINVLFWFFISLSPAFASDDRMLRREARSHMDLDHEEETVVMQISSEGTVKRSMFPQAPVPGAGPAPAPPQAKPAPPPANTAATQPTVTADLSAVFDTEHADIAGPACSDSQGKDSYEAACKFLRDYALFGFALFSSQIMYHASLADETRNTVRIAQLAPDDIYTSWVLPYQILSESPDYWRKPFRDALTPIALNQHDLTAAVQAIIPQIWALRTNDTFVKAALGQNATAFNTPLQFLAGASNTAVLETLKQGTANSVGLSIFAVAALRSVGIPARVVGVNSWGTASGGAYHWVEFWTCRDPKGNDVWSFFDADPGQTTLAVNSAWFVPSFTRFSQHGTLSGIYAGTFNRELPDGIWNVSIPNLKAPLQIPAVDVTDSYGVWNPSTTVTTKTTAIDPCVVAAAMNVSCTTTTTTTTMFICAER